MGAGVGIGDVSLTRLVEVITSAGCWRVSWGQDGGRTSLSGEGGGTHSLAVGGSPDIKGLLICTPGGRAPGLLNGSSQEFPLRGGQYFDKAGAFAKAGSGRSPLPLQFVSPGVGGRGVGTLGKRGRRLPSGLDDPRPNNSKCWASQRTYFSLSPGWTVGDASEA